MAERAAFNERDLEPLECEQRAELPAALRRFGTALAVAREAIAPHLAPHELRDLDAALRHATAAAGWPLVDRLTREPRRCPA